MSSWQFLSKITWNFHRCNTQACCYDIWMILLRELFLHVKYSMAVIYVNVRMWRDRIASCTFCYDKMSYRYIWFPQPNALPHIRIRDSAVFSSTFDLSFVSTYFASVVIFLESNVYVHRTRFTVKSNHSVVFLIFAPQNIEFCEDLFVNNVWCLHK